SAASDLISEYPEKTEVSIISMPVASPDDGEFWYQVTIGESSGYILARYLAWPAPPAADPEVIEEPSSEPEAPEDPADELDISEEPTVDPMTEPEIEEPPLAEPTSTEAVINEAPDPAPTQEDPVPDPEPDS